MRCRKSRYARGEATPESDVDFLVTFQGEPTFARYMGLKEELEMLLGRTVDLVTFDGLKPRIRDAVLAETHRVA
jgi:predicted nucleotidyltransferase